MNKGAIKNRMNKEHGWLVREKGGTLIFDRAYAARNIEFTLIPVKKGLYELQHPRYLYTSTVSHFKSIEDDVRLSLNKVYLRSVIRLLKRIGVWPHIINKNFIEVNDNNRKSNKGKVRRELRDLLKLDISALFD